MNIPIIPLQKSGILSAGAAGVALVLALIWQFTLPAQEILDPAEAMDSIPLTIVFLSAVVCLLVSLVGGLVAILRDREYALLVFLSVIFSAFGLFYSVWSMANL